MLNKTFKILSVFAVFLVDVFYSSTGQYEDSIGDHTLDLS